MIRRTGTAVLALAVVPPLTATTAGAAEDPPYVLALWEAPGGADARFSVPQVLAASTATASADLGQLDGWMECGTTYQVDLYVNDETTESLLAGGVLYGPSNPAESWPGGSRAEGDFSRRVTTPACPIEEGPVLGEPTPPDTAQAPSDTAQAAPEVARAASAAVPVATDPAYTG